MYFWFHHRLVPSSIANLWRLRRSRGHGKVVPFLPRVESLSERILPSTVTWINPTGGDWDTAANWDANRVPTAGDNAVIPQSDITVTHASATADAVRSISCEAALAISNGSLSLATLSTIDSTLALSGGTLAGAGDLNIYGQFNWTGGTQVGPGTTGARGGMVINGASITPTLDNRILDNWADAVWSGTRGIALNNGSILNNKDVATFDIQGDNSVTTSGLTGTFNNAGILTRSGGPTAGMVTFNTPLNNSGTVQIQIGILRLMDGGFANGTFTVSNPGMLNFNGGQYTLTSSSTVTGNGQVLFSGDVFSGGITNVGGAYDVTGRTTISGSGQIANFISDVTFPVLTLSGGALTGVGNVTIMGLFSWSGGTLSVTGQTFANGGINLASTIFSTPTLSGATLNNAGTATWSGTGGLSAGNGAVWNNLPGSTFLITSDRNFTVSSFAPVQFNNAGVVRKMASSDTTEIDLIMNNTGLVDVQTGTLVFGGGGTSSGAFTIAAPATLGFGAGNTTLTANSSVTGAGRVVFGLTSFSGGVTNIAGLYRPGSTTVSASGVNFLRAVEFPALTLSGGTLSSVDTITIDGLLTWSGGTMSGPGHTFANGGINVATTSNAILSGRTLDNAGTATWSGTGNLSASNGAVWNNLPGSTLVITSNTTFSTGFGGDPARLVNAGTIIKTASSNTTTFDIALINTGTIDVESGTVQLTGAFPNYASGALTQGTYVVKGTFKFADAAINDNEATLVLDGPGAQVMNQSSANALAGLRTNGVLGSFTIQNGRNFSAASTFTNLGVLTIGSNSRFTVTGSYTQGTGATDLATGVLVATQGVNIQDGLLGGSGTIEASVTNSGIVSPGGDGSAGILTITGDYTQTALGVLNIDIGGLAAGLEYDQLQVNGAVALDGTLNVNLINGFSPQPGDSFRFLTFSSQSGDFAIENGLDLGGGLVLSPSYGATGLTLTAQQQ
jgi:hypothetical protein